MTHHVLLLRTPPSNPLTDEYHSQLSSAGYTPHSISPLDTELQNIDRLAEVISSTNAGDFDGVIITSSRSIEAWTSAISSDNSHFNKDTNLQKWKNATFYVVGSKTASLLEQSLSNDLGPEGIRIKGAECGTAEKLAEYILKIIGETKQRLLYLTGDKNRDTLPNKLKEAGEKINLVPLQVYATCEHPDLREEIERYAARLCSGEMECQI